MINRVGYVMMPEKEFIKRYHIIGVIEVRKADVCVTHHSLSRYRERLKQADIKVSLKELRLLHRLRTHLRESDYLIHYNPVKAILANRMEKAVYRFYDGWVYVLIWSRDQNVWVLKTIYPLDGEMFEIIELASEEEKNNSWDSEYEPPKAKTSKVGSKKSKKR